MALDNIIYNDEMVFTFERGDGGIVSHVVTDRNLTINIPSIPLVESFTPELNITF